MINNFRTNTRPAEMTAEEWNKTIQEDNLRERILHLEETIDTIVELGGNLEGAFSLLKENDIDHRLDLDLVSKIPWVLYTLHDMREGLKIELDDMQTKQEKN